MLKALFFRQIIRESTVKFFGTRHKYGVERKEGQDMIKDILNVFPPTIRTALGQWNNNSEIEEIRVSCGKPIILKSRQSEKFLSDESGAILYSNKQDIEDIMCLCADHSMYLKEDEINSGYITIAGGCRVGICGTVSYLDDKIIHHGDITSINIRIAMEVLGCSKNVIPHIVEDGKVLNTLIISPPKGGKTTLLRDITRVLSDEYNMRIGVVDERKELYGVGNYDLGIRSDVLQGCKKPDGIMMLIRTMAPDIIVVDELGSIEDEKALMKACTCGISVIASIHGNLMKDIKTKETGLNFDRYVFIEDYEKFRVLKGDELK